MSRPSSIAQKEADGNSSAGTAGMIGGGNHFSGNGDFLQVSNSPSISPTNAISIEIMAKSDSTNWNDYGFLLSKHSAYLIHPNQNTTSFRFILTDSQGGVHQPSYGAAEITNWHYYAATYDGTVSIIYFDGQPVGNLALSASITNDPGDLAMGWDNRFPGVRYLIGSLDEARISTLPRSSNWIWACWINERSNAVFNTYSTVIKAPERGTVICVD